MQHKYLYTLLTSVVLCACQPNNQQHISPPSASNAAASVPTTASEPTPIAASTPPIVSASAASEPAAASDAAASAVAASDVKQFNKNSNKKIFVEHDEQLGSKLYLFSGSLKKDGNLVYALTENRFATAQKLPESQKTFQYSLIKEAVDCQKRLTDPVEVTHFSPKDEIVEKHTFPYPDYASWSELELKALADEHPNRQFIETVCQLVK